MRVAILLLIGLIVSRAESRPVENRLSQDPRMTSVEQLDLQILRWAARDCAFPTPQDTLRVALHYRIPIRLADARDPWGQPFVYNEPAIHGDVQFDLYSLGANGVDESGQGDDVANWRLRRDIANSWASRDDLTFWSRAYRTQRLVLEGKRTSANPLRTPDTSMTGREEFESSAESNAGSLLERILLLDVVLILLVAAVGRRRLGLVVLTAGAVITPLSSSVASTIEPGAIYRYTESQVYYLRWAILDFRATHCRYPAPNDTFAILADAGLDSIATLGGARDYWGRPFVLRAPWSRDDERFDLYSVGRNGIDEHGGGDDIGVDEAQKIFETHYAPRPSGGRGGGSRSSAGNQGRTEPGSPPESHSPESLFLVARWLGHLDAPLVVLGLLWLRRRRSKAALPDDDDVNVQ